MTANQAKLRLTIIALLSVQIIAMFYFQSIAAAHTTLTDDYYYYERIARNLVSGIGSTFDGVVQTNGYHPLWLLFVAPGVLAEKETGLPAQVWSLSICALLSIGLLTALCWSIPRLTLSATAAIMTLAAYCIFFGVMGMETFRNARMAEHQGALVEAAQRLQHIFAAEPDAVVAMGDRAGAVGEVLPNRLIQLEGLVMDSNYLKSLHEAKSIVDILKSYNVHYYVATGSRRNEDGCYTTWEPSQSRGDSFKLESRVCAPVVDTFTLDGYTTIVFDVSKI